MDDLNDVDRVSLIIDENFKIKEIDPLVPDNKIKKILNKAKRVVCLLFKFIDGEIRNRLQVVQKRSSLKGTRI